MYILVREKGIFKKRWINIWKDGKIYKEERTAQRDMSNILSFTTFTKMKVFKIEDVKIMEIKPS